MLTFVYGTKKSNCLGFTLKYDNVDNLYFFFCHSASWALFSEDAADINFLSTRDGDQMDHWVSHWGPKQKKYGRVTTEHTNTNPQSCSICRTAIALALITNATPQGENLQIHIFNFGCACVLHYS